MLRGLPPAVVFVLNLAPALLAGAGLVTMAYVALAGLRAAAFVAVLKDALMLGAIHVGDEDGVIAGFVVARDPALEVRERVLE